MELAGGLAAGETWRPMEDAAQTHVLHSASQLFGAIKKSLQRCARFVSRGEAMLRLMASFQARRLGARTRAGPAVSPAGRAAFAAGRAWPPERAPAAPAGRSPRGDRRGGPPCSRVPSACPPVQQGGAARAPTPPRPRSACCASMRASWWRACPRPRPAAPPARRRPARPSGTSAWPTTTCRSRARSSRPPSTATRWSARSRAAPPRCWTRPWALRRAPGRPGPGPPPPPPCAPGRKRCCHPGAGREGPRARAQVSVAEEEDAFQGAVTACLSVLVLGTETRLDAALAAMTRVPWASLEAARPCPGALPAALASSDCPLAQAAPAAGPSVRSAIAGTPRGPLRVRERGAARAQVGDQSDFVTAFSRVLSEVAPAVGGALSPLHFRYFCDKLAASFCPRFYENIFRRAPGGRAWPPAHWLRRMLTGGRSRERGACAPVSAAATRAGAVRGARRRHSARPHALAAACREQGPAATSLHQKQGGCSRRKSHARQHACMMLRCRQDLRRAVQGVTRARRRCRKVGEAGSQQLLLDTQAIKALLLDLPSAGAPRGPLAAAWCRVVPPFCEPARAPGLHAHRTGPGTKAARRSSGGASGTLRAAQARRPRTAQGGWRRRRARGWRRRSRARWAARRRCSRWSAAGRRTWPTTSSRCCRPPRPPTSSASSTSRRARRAPLPAARLRRRRPGGERRGAPRQVMRRPEQQAVLDAFNRRLGRPGAAGALRPAAAAAAAAASAPGAAAGAQAGALTAAAPRGAGATQELMARFRRARVARTRRPPRHLRPAALKPARPAQVWRQPGRAPERRGGEREGARDDGGVAGAAQESGQPGLLAQRARPRIAAAPARRSPRGRGAAGGRAASAPHVRGCNLCTDAAPATTSQHTPGETRLLEGAKMRV